MTISPKVIPPVLIALAASIALAILTGDMTWLLGILVGLAQGGAAAAAAPAPNVSQREVEALADVKAKPPRARDRDEAVAVAAIERHAARR